MVVENYLDWRGYPVIWAKYFDRRFEGSARNDYSQFGEDGMIQKAFELFGVDNQWCFELGAADGEYLSNTLRWRERGWKSVLAESHPVDFHKLETRFGKSSCCFHETVTDMDHLLERTGCPLNPDLGVIDVDGQDYWLFKSMVKYRPRVFLIEYCPYDFAVEIGQRWPMDGKLAQASRGLITQLAMEKNYVPMARTFCNLLFIDGEIYGDQTKFRRGTCEP